MGKQQGNEDGKVHKGGMRGKGKGGDKNKWDGIGKGDKQGLNLTDEVLGDDGEPVSRTKKGRGDGKGRKGGMVGKGNDGNGKKGKGNRKLGKHGGRKGQGSLAMGTVSDQGTGDGNNLGIGGVYENYVQDLQKRGVKTGKIKSHEINSRSGIDTVSFKGGGQADTRPIGNSSEVMPLEGNGRKVGKINSGSGIDTVSFKDGRQADTKPIGHRTELMPLEVNDVELGEINNGRGINTVSFNDGGQADTKQFLAFDMNLAVILFVVSLLVAATFAAWQYYKKKKNAENLMTLALPAGNKIVSTMTKKQVSKVDAYRDYANK